MKILPLAKIAAARKRLIEKETDTDARGPVATAICMGMDALRICVKVTPKNYSYDEVMRWMRLMKPTPRRDGE